MRIVWGGCSHGQQEKRKDSFHSSKPWQMQYTEMIQIVRGVEKVTGRNVEDATSCDTIWSRRESLISVI